MRQPAMIRAGCLEVSTQVRLEVLSQTLRPKFSILGVFLALPTKTSFTTSQNYPKYEVWAIEILCGRIPLRLSQSPYPLTVKYLQGFYRNGYLLNVLNATFGSLAMQQIALICILKIWSSLLWQNPTTHTHELYFADIRVTSSFGFDLLSSWGGGDTNHISTRRERWLQRQG